MTNRVVALPGSNGVPHYPPNSSTPYPAPPRLSKPPAGNPGVPDEMKAGPNTKYNSDPRYPPSANNEAEWDRRKEAQLRKEQKGEALKLGSQWAWSKPAKYIRRPNLHEDVQVGSDTSSQTSEKVE